MRFFCLKITLPFFIFCMVAPCNSQEIQLQLRMIENISSGFYPDGTLIGEGDVIVNQYPANVKISVDGYQYNNSIYKLVAENKKLNNLIVRLDFSGKSNPENIIRLESESLRFRVVTDGDQKINPDVWKLAITANLLNAE